MNHARIRQLVLCALLALVAAGAHGGVPQLVNYQGKLTNSGGTPLPDGAYSVTFTIYDALAGGTVLWTEVQSITTNGGLFAVLLGSVTPITETVFSSSLRYLQIKVGSDPEITPRTQLTSVPFAFRALKADTALAVPNLPLESGIAAWGSTTGTVLTSTTAQDILTIYITTPAAGYIVIDGKFVGYTSATYGANSAYVQIDETAGGTTLTPPMTVFGADGYATPVGVWWPGYVTRVYSKPAGSYTFRMEGGQWGTSGGASVAVYWPMLRATYYPRSYGTVIGATADGAPGPEKLDPLPAVQPDTGIKSETTPSAK